MAKSHSKNRSSSKSRRRSPRIKSDHGPRRIVIRRPTSHLHDHPEQASPSGLSGLAGPDEATPGQERPPDESSPPGGECEDWSSKPDCPDEVSPLLKEWRGGIGGFVRHLDRLGIRYLAYSQVSSLEFCPYRYYLEYVRRVRLIPEPDYFIKGRIFHDALARYYRGCAGGRVPSVQTLHKSIDRHNREDGHHLKNAITLALQNIQDGWEVVAVEEPFVLQLGWGLPPCVGVIDLILRKGDCLAVIDHKSGRNFNENDALQLAIYRQHVCHHFKAGSCLAMYDEYRWVNNLGRIRKPAFQRTEVPFEPDEWKQARERIARRHEEMLAIQMEKDARGGGSCYICPFKEKCRKASYGSW